MRTQRIIIIYIVLILSFICGCTPKPSSPAKLFRITKKAVLKNDWERYWHLLSVQSRKRFDDQVTYMKKNFNVLSDSSKERVLSSLNISYKKFEQLDGQRFFIRYMTSNMNTDRRNNQYTKDLFKSCEIIDIEQKDGRAVLTLEDEEGHQAKIPMVKENDGWKLDFAQFYAF